MQDHPGGGGGVQGADGLLRGLLLHPRREADQGPALQVAHTSIICDVLLLSEGFCNIYTILLQTVPDVSSADGWNLCHLPSQPQVQDLLYILQ